MGHAHSSTASVASYYENKLATHSLSDHELVIKITNKLEYKLEKNLNAQGRGLHEKISSCEGQLKDSLVSRLRYLATIHGNLIHKPTMDEIPNRTVFLEIYDRVERELDDVVIPRRRLSNPNDGRKRRHLFSERRTKSTISINLHS